MSWYKISKDFGDRNIINNKIIYLQEIKEILSKISKVIFQSAKTAKDNNYKIITGKKISSYPIVKDLLVQADVIALDNPWKFSAFCEAAIESIDILLNKLHDEREDFTKGKDAKYQKGWF